MIWYERAIHDQVVPRLTSAASQAGRPAPRIVAGVPVALCSDKETDAARAYASEVLGHADFSPNYVRLLEHGDAEDVGATMAAGDESAVVTRLRHYCDAGVTDLAARIEAPRIWLVSAATFAAYQNPSPRSLQHANHGHDLEHQFGALSD